MGGGGGGGQKIRIKVMRTRVYPEGHLLRIKIGILSILPPPTPDFQLLFFVRCPFFYTKPGTKDTKDTKPLDYDPKTF